MPIRTGYIRQVSKNPRHPQRYDVYLNDGIPILLHTIEPPEKALMASLCEKSMSVHRAVTCRTMDGVYGERIVGVELVPHEQEQAS